MKTLRDLLANLNTCENNWSLHINPDDIDDYTISQYEIKNKINVGKLSDLSCYDSDLSEAISQLLGMGAITYKGQKLECTPKEIYDLVNAFWDGDLEPDLELLLEVKAQALCDQWSYEKADIMIVDIIDYMNYIQDQQTKIA